jgi:hypothetical protein
MQNSQQHGMKKEFHSTNRFNDSEYDRWSQGLKTIQSGNPKWGLESFLNTTDGAQPEHANMCVPFNNDWQEMKKGRITNMAWKLREWKRALEQLHNRCRSMVVEIVSTLGDEEARIARTELDRRSDCVTTSSVRQETE